MREYSCGHEILTLGDSSKAWEWKATMDPPYPINNLSAGLLLECSPIHGTSQGCCLRCRQCLSNNDALSALGGKLCHIHSATTREIAIWLAEDEPKLTCSVARYATESVCLYQEILFFLVRQLVQTRYSSPLTQAPVQVCVDSQN